MVDNIYMCAKLEIIIKIVFNLIIIIGCSSQFISIVKLYLTYPTSIHIDTQFDIRYNNLASFTFCKRTSNLKLDRNSNVLFEYYRGINVIDQIALSGREFHKVIDLEDPDNYYITRVDSVSLNYYCLNLQGELS